LPPSRIFEGVARESISKSSSVARIERSEIRDRPIKQGTAAPGFRFSLNPGYTFVPTLATAKGERENGISSIVI
jgi:hypothetical protein